MFVLQHLLDKQDFKAYLLICVKLVIEIFVILLDRVNAPYDKSKILDFFRNSLSTNEESTKVGHEEQSNNSSVKNGTPKFSFNNPISEQLSSSGQGNLVETIRAQ